MGKGSRPTGTILSRTTRTVGCTQPLPQAYWRSSEQGYVRGRGYYQLGLGMPRVSVVMAVYNGERFLRQAIDSILSQTYTDFEFIIADDGSTDGTGKILGMYQDRRIVRLKNEKNVGLAESLNRGLAIARGEFVARMDADDVSRPERLAEQLSYLDSNPQIGLLGTDFCLMDAAGALTSGPILKGSLSSAAVEWALCWGNPIVHPSVMFRAGTARSCGGYPEGYQYYAEDYALWLHMLQETQAAVLGQPLLYLRKHEHNVTVVDLHAHTEEVLGVAQSALADRLGYRPSARCIRLVRQLPIDGPVSSSDMKQSIALLRDAFQSVVTRYGLDRAHLCQIDSDLPERLLQLVQLYGGGHRAQSLVAFLHALRLSPQTALSSVRTRTLLRVLLGQRLTGVVRHIRQTFSLG